MPFASKARRLLLLTPWALALAGPGAWAQDFPSRPITVVVPQATGGTNDIVGRLVAQKLGEVMGAAVVVENRPGAGGNIGTAHVAKTAPKDGHTVLLTISSAQAINPALYKNPGFDPVKDFVPLGYIGAVPNVLVAHPSFPAKTLPEFLAHIRSKPGHYQYASAGNGTLNHLLGEMLNDAAGVKLQHVPYKGVAAAVNDVIGGQVPMAFATPASVLQHIRTGRLVALGVSTAQRSPSLPQVPSIGEQVPGFAGSVWIAVYAARGLPAAAETKLQQGLAKAMDTADLKDKLAAQGVEFASVSPAQMNTLLNEELVRWAKLVKLSGATVD